MNFNLRTLMVAIAVIAVGCANFAYPGSWCAGLLAFMVWLSIVLSAVVAIVGKDRLRAFCIGFALVGATYCIMVFFPVWGSLPSPQGAVDFIARKVNDFMTPAYLARVARPGYSPKFSLENGMWNIGPNNELWSPSGAELASNMRTANELAILLFGCVGGLVALRVAPPSRSDQSPGATAH
jgi:hypothetical protein